MYTKFGKLLTENRVSWDSWIEVCCVGIHDKDNNRLSFVLKLLFFPEHSRRKRPKDSFSVLTKQRFGVPVNVVFQERVLEYICYDVLNLFVPIRAFPLGSCSKPQVSGDETTQTPNLYTMYILLLYVCKPCILTTKDFLLMNKIMVWCFLERSLPCFKGFVIEILASKCWLPITIRHIMSEYTQYIQYILVYTTTQSQ